MLELTCFFFYSVSPTKSRQVKLLVGRRHAGTKWYDYLEQGPDEVSVDKDGFAIFSYLPAVRVFVRR